ncbi:hypothetical protein [Streptomyces sp. NPDC056549]|uniref:hypothetical protein n=1 Tax=Streptomyces sp. NPDC056549 TaxID=3345864 RepID=UPI0036B6F38E
MRPLSRGDTRLLLAGIARIARVGRAAVVDWRRSHADFPAPTDVHPEFDRRAVVAWLLAHDKIAVPSGVPAATLTVGPSAAQAAAPHTRRPTRTTGHPAGHRLDDATP